MKINIKRRYPFYYYKEMQCSKCEGLGYYELFAGCNVPQTDCCGGCYDTKYCERCDGDGYTKLEKGLEELIEIYKNKKQTKWKRNIDTK